MTRITADAFSAGAIGRRCRWWRGLAAASTLGVAGIALAVAAAAGQAGEAAGGDAAVAIVSEQLDASRAAVESRRPSEAAGHLAEAVGALEGLADSQAGSSEIREILERCEGLKLELQLEGISAVDELKLPSVGRIMRQRASLRSKARQPERPSPPPGRPSPPPAPVVSFARQIAPMLARSCGGCHVTGSKGGFSLVCYDRLMKSGMVHPGDAAASRMVEVIATGDMPRGGGRVQPAELAMLAAWINSGAAFDGDDPQTRLDRVVPRQDGPPPAAAAPEIRPGEVRFSTDVAGVLIEQCGGCHSAGESEAGLSLASHDAMLRGGESGAAVIPGQGAGSLLVRKLKGVDIDGQRMPRGRPPLPDEVIARIERWIDEGARLDLASGSTPLATLAAEGRSMNLSHEKLRELRFEQAAGIWSRGIVDEKPRTASRGDILVVGNLSEAEIARVAEAAAAAAADVREAFGLADDVAPAKGGLVIYAFAHGYDLSNFWQNVVGKERPRGLEGFAAKSGDVLYAAVVLDAGDDPADRRARLTEQVAAASLLARASPQWFASGAGRSLAGRVVASAPLVTAWASQQRNLAEQMTAVGSKERFFADEPSPAKAAVAAAFVARLDPGGRSLPRFIARLDESGDFTAAFSEVYRAPPQQSFLAWAAGLNR